MNYVRIRNISSSWAKAAGRSQVILGHSCIYVSNNFYMSFFSPTPLIWQVSTSNSDQQ